LRLWLTSWSSVVRIESTTVHRLQTALVFTAGNRKKG